MDYPKIKSHLLDVIQDLAPTPVEDWHYANKLIADMEYNGKPALSVIRAIAYIIMQGTKGDWASVRRTGTLDRSPMPR